MKILMIAPEPFFEPRGTPFSIYQRLKALSSLSHQVDLVTYHVGEDVYIPGVTICRIPRVPFIKQIKVGPSWAKPLLDFLVLFTMLRLLINNQYDVIHSHEEAAFFSMFMSKLFGIPHLYDMHSSLPKQLGNFGFGDWWWLVKTFELFERLVLNSCDAVITIGIDLEKLVVQINPDVRHMTIHNIPLHAYESSKDSHLSSQLRVKLNLDSARPIVYAGTFETYQGLNLLLDSAMLVINQYPNALFILVGGKPKQIDSLRSEVSKRQLGDSVHFAGTVTPEESLSYLEVAEILVSPRIRGTSVPLKIYSYLEAGKPIVASNLYAHSQVLDESVAVLVEPTKEALSEGICLCLRDPEHSKQLASSAQERANKTYNYESYMLKVEKVYDYFAPDTIFVSETQTSESLEI